MIIYGLFFGFICWGLITKKKNIKNEEATPISVIIPFRNEEKKLDSIVKSFNSLNYNLNIVEFIFVDDHSTDKGLEVLKEALINTNLIYKIIKQPKHITGKKNAIIKGVEKAKNEAIVTTDADTTHSKKWLTSYSLAFKNKAEFIIAPVINQPSKSFIGQLHNTEALILSGITVGSASLNSPILCSGANMGYTKSIFNSINPYNGNLTITSGDDMFFLDKILKAGKKVEVLDNKEALAFTQGNNSYSEVLSQSIRWSSKNKELKNKTNLYLSILIFLTNTLLYINLFSLIYSNFIALNFILLKFLIDVILLIIISIKFNQKQLISNAPFIYILYPIHLIIIFVSSFFVKVKWKERMVSVNGE